MARPISRALQQYVLDWQRVPWPVPWNEVLGRAAPLSLEIGFGNGAFLEEQARARPEREHLGIELSWTAATHLFRRLQRGELDNVHVLLGEAETLVRHLFAGNTLSEVFVNHPCPWPKERHVERRLLNREFLSLLAERMTADAALTIVTDHAGYAAWLHGELGAQCELVSRHPTVEIGEIPGRTPTKYQSKAMAQGVPIHYFEWRKVSSSASSPDGSRPAPEMPTLILSGEVPSAELFRDFRPLLFRERVQEVEVIVRLESVYQRADAPVWLLETLVQEDRLRQQFGIDVVARGAQLLLKPSGIGWPYPTHGVKRAVWCVARWLSSRHPHLELRNESLGLRPPSEPWPPGEKEPASGVSPKLAADAEPRSRTS